MEAFLTSTLSVAVAEIGDKTQLLSLFLASRFRNRWAIIGGIIVATLVNHGLSAWLGRWLTQLLPAGWLPWIIGASFVLIALWVLIPDKDDDDDSALLKRSAFLATLVLFFLAEIGDKTQIATVVLAAHYPDATVAVVAGTTLGMLLANVPVILAGRWLMARLPLKAARIGASVLFLVLGGLTLVSAYSG